MHNKLELELDSDSIFYKLGSSGLITFSDYIFLLTVLSSEYKFNFYFLIHYLSRLWSMFLGSEEAYILKWFIGINGLYNIFICELLLKVLSGELQNL